jgi:gamma-glutamylputrescine oxidase
VIATSAVQPALDRRLARGLLPLNTYIIVTEPLGDGDALPIQASCAVYDDRFATGYYRLVEDDATGRKRLIWGGRIGIEAAPSISPTVCAPISVGFIPNSRRYGSITAGPAR